LHNSVAKSNVHMPPARIRDSMAYITIQKTASRLSNQAPLFNVFLVAEKKSPVTARAGYSVNPHYDFNDHPEIDVLIVAGGVHGRELGKASVLNWVSKTENNAQIVASVCTGAFILAEAGLLSGLSVTTHWEDLNDLKDAYPELTIIPSQRWVDQGRFITSGGISAGIDMSLHLVSRLANTDLAEKTARQMEFDWLKTDKKLGSQPL